jgi:hypothetical protein
MKPKFTYLSDASRLTSGETVKGSARVLDLHGRKGIHPQSMHTVIKLEGGHTINEPKGTFVLWFFALEDLAASFLADNMKMDNEDYANYCFPATTRCRASSRPPPSISSGTASTSSALSFSEAPFIPRSKVLLLLRKPGFRPCPST